ncbi:hypothetical protein BWI15_15200 [Kribbella sp. ALI-6-A]|nr:hypothetical protein BWI15_15200 [Kribbella sp. ALI-6-A]
MAGLVVGVVVGWLAVALTAYAGTQLYTRRLQRFDTDQSATLPYLVALIAIGLVLGLLMSVSSIGSGVMTGVGLLMTVVGVALQVLPIRTTIDAVKLFELPGQNTRGLILLMDGALVVVGVLLLVAGARRMVAESRRSMPPYYLDSRAQPGLYPHQPSQHSQQPAHYPQQPGQIWPGPPQPPGRPGPQDRPH